MNAAMPLDSLASLGAALARQPSIRRGVRQLDRTIRVVLADDHALVREGIRALLGCAPDVEIVGEAGTGREAVAVARRVAPDVVVMDLDMPEGGGLEATRALVAAKRHPRVLVLTMHAEDEHLIPTLQAGATGFLSKDAAERELVDAIRAVAAGDVYVRPRVARILAGNRRLSPTTSREALRARFDALSERERTVLRLVAEGYSGPEIGRQLGIAAKTVDTYKQRIEDKVQLTHRTDYVRFALAAGILGR